MRRAIRQEGVCRQIRHRTLLNQSGPLGQLEVRLKLIFALGLISPGALLRDPEACLKIRVISGARSQGITALQRQADPGFCWPPPWHQSGAA